MDIKYDKKRILLPDDVRDAGSSSEDMSDVQRGHGSLDLKIKAHQNARLLGAIKGTDGSHKVAAKLKQLYMDSTKGMNKSQTMQHTHKIPLIVWDFACRTYGKEELKSNDKLFNRLFEPWVVVSNSRLRT